MVPSASPESIAAAKLWLAESAEWAEAALVSFLDGVELGPGRIADATRYALLGGGKRIRPALVRLLSGDADLASARAAAVAIECVHTYSLVHDDLPCMDDDDLRRGRPTVHRAFDEATAVLAGDALLTLAFEALATGVEPGNSPAAARVLARAAGPAGMIGGQVLDLQGEGQDLDASEIHRIHALKTGALLGAAAELGAIVGGAGPSGCDVARRFGVAVGMTFQAMDDVLDVTGDAATLGKTPGKDAEAGKGTLVAALGLDGARAAAESHAEEARGLAREAGLGDLGCGLVDLLVQRTQ